MSYIYFLAGEDLELAEAELKGFLKSQNVDEEPEKHGKIVETDSEPSQLKRLALTHEISKILDKGDLESFEPVYVPEKSFAVRAVDVNNEGYDTKNWERKAGKLMKTENNSVDLENPEESIRLYLFEEKYFLARLVEDIDRGLFEQRKNQNRPFSSPVSLDPVLARVLVNLSEAPTNGSLIDPFCGTGGILIEAGLCNIFPTGIDIKKEMVEGSRKNLEEYGLIMHDIRQGKVENWEELFEDQIFDAVVTDLPYGKSSKVEGSPVETFLENMDEMTAGKKVFVYDKPELEGFSAKYSVYIHGSMTRYIFVE